MISINKIFAFLTLILIVSGFSQNVIIVVIDGARYIETFGAGETNIPNIWNNLKPLGTIYTNFYNNGITSTNPGHASIITGNWETVANDGSQRPTNPTLFEYNRDQKQNGIQDNFLVAGANKLAAITYSNHPEYGATKGASSVTNDYLGDLATYDSLVSVMDNYNPELILVNFKGVDIMGHTGIWQNYLDAIKMADSLVYLLWQKISNDTFYMNRTTLLVTNDHGRHDDSHGGFASHGCSCEGCRHIMLLGVGKSVIPNQVISETKLQIDIAPTCAELLSINAVYSSGSSLFSGDQPLPVSLSSFQATQDRKLGNIVLKWETESEMENLGFIIERRRIRENIWHNLDTYNENPSLKGQGSTSYHTDYKYVDEEVVVGETYEYRLSDVDYANNIAQSDTISITVGANYYLKSTQKNILLHNAFPNPFNPETTIFFSLPEETFVKLIIFDLKGQVVKILREATTSLGQNEIHWNGRDTWDNPVSTGIYICNLQSGKKSETLKIVHLR